MSTPLPPYGPYDDSRQDNTNPQENYPVDENNNSNEHSYVDDTIYNYENDPSFVDDENADSSEDEQQPRDDSSSVTSQRYKGSSSYYNVHDTYHYSPAQGGHGNGHNDFDSENSSYDAYSQGSTLYRASSPQENPYGVQDSGSYNRTPVQNTPVQNTGDASYNDSNWPDFLVSKGNQIFFAFTSLVVTLFSGVGIIYSFYYLFFLDSSHEKNNVAKVVHWITIIVPLLLIFLVFLMFLFAVLMGATVPLQ